LAVPQTPPPTQISLPLPNAPDRPIGGAILINGSPIRQPSVFNPGGSPPMQGRHNGNGVARCVLLDPGASAEEEGV
jgi:hypothetical protein